MAKEIDYKLKFFTTVAAVTTVCALCSTSVFVVMIYNLLRCCHADSFTWFLFWFYGPLAIALSVLSQHFAKMAQTITKAEEVSRESKV